MTADANQACRLYVTTASIRYCVITGSNVGIKAFRAARNPSWSSGIGAAPRIHCLPLSVMRSQFGFGGVGVFGHWITYPIVRSWLWHSMSKNDNGWISRNRSQAPLKSFPASAARPTRASSFIVSAINSPKENLPCWLRDFKASRIAPRTELSLITGWFSLNMEGKGIRIVFDKASRWGGFKTRG